MGYVSLPEGNINQPTRVFFLHRSPGFSQWNYKLETSHGCRTKRLAVLTPQLRPAWSCHVWKKIKGDLDRCGVIEDVPKRYPLVNDHIAGWNITIFNRIHTSSNGPFSSQLC